MKAKRRKDLRTNELIQTVQETWAAVRKYGSYIAAAAIAVVLVIGLGWYWRHGKAQQLEQGWSQLAAARSGQAGVEERIERLRAIVAEHGGGSLAVAARQTLGDMLMGEAIGGAGMLDAGRQEELLAQAEEHYRQIVAEPAKQWVALGAALTGLAKMAEQRGDFDQARQWYQAIIEDGKLAVTPYHRVAETGLASLADLAEPVEFVVAQASTQPAASAPVPLTVVPALTVPSTRQAGQD
jgi:hypothetical protein